MSGISHAVFLSYASQDAEAAHKICEALRAARIDVFLDQSELRGGDAWDQRIRHEIHNCALFIPIVSQHTQARLEGYFRHEWKLAIERTHHMAEQMPFLVPVVVDGTHDREAFVPDAFRAVQWTRLPGGEAPPAFAERIKRLLSPELSPLSAVSGATAPTRAPVRATWRSKPVLLALAAVCAALAYLFADKFWISKHLAPASAAFAPPPHSIAVLPFVNLSGDKEQEYFSDGLTEELLNSLTEINELQVAARTSTFSFKGTNTDFGTIARKLNVSAIMEGSVRRSGNTIRITAQLINAVTGFHLWSKTYDRDLGDVLKLQTEIATGVAEALKVTLLADVGARIELGGTRNPAAFDAFLRGAQRGARINTSEDALAGIEAFTQAINRDPAYALAWAWRSIGLEVYASGFATEATVRAYFERARSDAQQALTLAPGLAEARLAMARYLMFGALDFTGALREFDRAVSLAPGNAMVLRNYGFHAVLLGRTEAGLRAARRAVDLDPLSRSARGLLAATYLAARRYQDAAVGYQQVLALDPSDPIAHAYRGVAYYLAGDLQRARASCEAGADTSGKVMCLAVTYHRLGKHADAERVVHEDQVKNGDDNAFNYAAIYAQWGDRQKALEWLETSLRLRHSVLSYMNTEALLDPLRKEPRFQAIVRELKFPPQ